MDDAFRVQRGWNSGKGRGEQDLDQVNDPNNPDVYVDEGGVPYIKVKSLPEDGDAWSLWGKASEYSDVKKFKIPKLLAEHPEKIIDFRTLWGHYKQGTRRFTAKEYDDHSTFEYYYFGARYFDPRIGTFTSIDKAAQFPSGYNYGWNNPIIGVDPDGNFFWIPIIIGAYMGAAAGILYAQETGNNVFLCMLGGAMIGGFSGYFGAVAGTGSAVAGLAAGSYANSWGWKMMTMGKSDFTINLGFAQWNVDNSSLDMADFSGNTLEDINTVTGWMAFSEDYSKVMAPVDRFVWGDPEPMMEGGPTYDEIMEQLEGAKPGAPTVHAMYEHTLKRQWWKHTNPADILWHGPLTLLDRWFNARTHGRQQFRYYGGLHWGGEKIGKLTGWYHYDLYDSVYGPLNCLSHNAWEVLFPGLRDPLYAMGRSYYSPYTY
ncbi:MAG: RHS repeat-associated core domain-containing protein [bacterium]